MNYPKDNIWFVTDHVRLTTFLPHNVTFVSTLNWLISGNFLKWTDIFHQDRLLKPGVPYIHQWTGLSLIQVMARPPARCYAIHCSKCWFILPLEHNSMELSLQWINFMIALLAIYFGAGWSAKFYFFSKRMYTFSQENRPKLPLAKRDARGEGLCDKYTPNIYPTGQLKHDT